MDAREIGFDPHRDGIAEPGAAVEISPDTGQRLNRCTYREAWTACSTGMRRDGNGR